MKLHDLFLSCLLSLLGHGLLSAKETFFNGKDLSGWSAEDMSYWSVQDGAIVGTKGDQKIPSISAASIIAKVSRDKFIKKLSKQFNGYGWDTNSGYGTKEHLRAIKKLGITKHHRKTFSPISDFL